MKSQHNQKKKTHDDPQLMGHSKNSSNSSNNLTLRNKKNLK